MAIEVGSAYVSIIPSFQSFGSSVQRELTDSISAAVGKVVGELDKAGTEGGKKFSKGLETEAKKGVKSAQDSIKDLATTIGAVAVVGGGIGQAISQGLSKEKLQASFGFTPQEAKQAADTSSKIYSQAWGESLDDVNSAVGSVAQGLKGLSTGGASVEDLTTRALAFKGAFGAEVPETIRAVSQMLRTGLAPDAKSAFDVLAVGMQNGSNKADDLIDTFNEYGTQFRKLGLDGPKALGLISQAVQAGARDSDVAADALKEFSIRAIDGSKTTGNAFHDLGLDADAMAQQIAKGGPAAEAGLSTVLQRLKEIKDPAKQAQIATGLFGTQAEDLGAALYAMDPATATASNGLDKMSGAGQRVQDSMNNATSPMESFKRQALGAMADTANKFLPAINSILEVIKPFNGEIGAAVFAVGGFVLAMKGIEMVKSAVDTMRALNLVTKAQSVVSGIATAAQWLWNAAMSANPVALIVIALVALVAAFIYAYKHSETFRNIVHTALHAVADAGKWMWESVLKPAFEGLKSAWEAVAGAFGWAWDNVLKPVFGFFRDHWQLLIALIMPGVGIIIAAVRLIISHWSQIKAAAASLWAGVKSVFDGIRTAWNTTVNGIVAAWNAVGVPLFRGVATVVSWLVNGVRVAFGGIRDAWNAVVNGMLWAYNNVLRPVLSAVISAVSGAAGAASRVFSGLRAAFTAAFTGARDAVVAGWNAIAGFINSRVLGPIRTTFHVGIPMLPTFAGGGEVRGPGTSTSDSILALLSNGEFVLNAGAVQTIGVDRLEAANRGGLPAYADGGMVGADAGRPAPVLAPVGTAATTRAAPAGGPGTQINVYPHKANFDVDDLRSLQARQDALARVGRAR